MTATRELEPDIQELERVTIRFAGDSGDGMQLTGTQFTRTAAVFGNDISTLPDFPAEIRAPAGSLPGVSGFQISFSSSDIHTPGDQPDVLVAMNPAALKTNIGDLPAGGALIVNSDAFTQQNLNKAAYASNPLTDGSLKSFTVFEVPISTLNERSLDGLEMTSKQKDLTKNFFALGLMFWLYERSQEGDDPLDRPEVRGPTGRRRGEQAGAQGGLRLRRDDRGVPHPLSRPSRQARPRRLPEHHRQRGHGARLPDRLATGRSRAVLRQLPDHPRVGHPPPAVRLQVVRGQDVPGRGRDRRDRGRHRRVVRRRARADRLVGARASRSSRRRWASPSWSSCRSSSSTSSAPDPRPGCRPRTSRRTCSR